MPVRTTRSSSSRNRRSTTNLGRSKARLEQELGSRADYIAYPYGDVSGIVRRVARRHYRLGFSVTQGSWQWRDDPFAINRILVTSADTPASLLLQLREFSGGRLQVLNAFRHQRTEDPAD